jgi:hypothetical protein
MASGAKPQLFNGLQSRSFPTNSVGTQTARKLRPPEAIYEMGPWGGAGARAKFFSETRSVYNLGPARSAAETDDPLQICITHCEGLGERRLGGVGNGGEID